MPLSKTEEDAVWQGNISETLTKEFIFIDQRSTKSTKPQEVGRGDETSLLEPSLRKVSHLILILL